MPNQVTFLDAQQERVLNTSEPFTIPNYSKTSSVTPFLVPPPFVELAKCVACHRDQRRWDLLYRVLWRLTTTEPYLLEIVSDDDMLSLHRMEKAVRRDAHKMKAFVRFRRIEKEGLEHFIAWYQPDHDVVRLVAPFFARRFGSMLWAVLTPDASLAGMERSFITVPDIPAILPLLRMNSTSFGKPTTQIFLTQPASR